MAKKISEVVFTFGSAPKASWTEDQVCETFLLGMLTILKSLPKSLSNFSGLIRNIAVRGNCSSLVIRVVLQEIEPRKL
jgi:hypothetical protein